MPKARHASSGSSLTVTVSEDELVRLATALAPQLRPGSCVALSGDLGAGKTTFARALVRSLAGDPHLDVPSPTFALRQDYDTPAGPVVHFDLYRISDPRDLDELGFEEALASAITVVEWPERAGGLLPDGRIVVALTNTPDPAARRVAVSGLVASLDS
jgi:N-acetylmuramate 1-kinase